MRFRLFVYFLMALPLFIAFSAQSLAIGDSKTSPVSTATAVKTPVDKLAGAYNITMYGAPYEKDADFSHIEATQGVLVVTKRPFSQKQLPPEPRPAFAFYHYHLLGVDSSEYNVCLWLRPKYSDDDITRDVSFIVTSYRLDSGKYEIPISRSPDSGITIRDIKLSPNGFTAVADTFLVEASPPVGWKQSVVAVRDDKLSLEECLDDGVHVATVMDDFNHALVKMRESLDDWFYSKKDANKKN